MKICEKHLHKNSIKNEVKQRIRKFFKCNRDLVTIYISNTYKVILMFKIHSVLCYKCQHKKIKNERLNKKLKLFFE